jgi:hypothetical protein
MQDDFDPESEKQAQLRDCEQQLKRIFTLCLNDRFVHAYQGVTQTLIETELNCMSRENGASTS